MILIKFIFGIWIISSAYVLMICIIKILIVFINFIKKNHQECFEKYLGNIMDNPHKIHSDYDKPWCWQYDIRLKNFEEDNFWSMLTDKKIGNSKS